MFKQLCKLRVSMSRRIVPLHFQTVFGLALCGSAMLISCGGNPPPPTLQSVSVSPKSATVAAGLTQQYSASGNYSDGTSKPLSSITWTTSDTTVGTVNSSGLVTTLKQGSVTVSATSGSSTGTAGLTVGPPNLVSIAVSPQNPTISAGKSQQFTATGTFSDGTMQVLTNVTWSSGTTSVATIDVTGLASGVAAGSSLIEATSGDVNGSSMLMVTEPILPAVSYLLGATFSAGGANPQGLVVADFNGDGKPDIAVSNEFANTINVFLNDGTGNFGNPITTTTQTTTIGPLTVGDFNEDGKLDLAISASGAQTIILLGNGDGTFTQQPAIADSCGFLQAKVADLNGDGHKDLVFACNGSTSAALGKGDGTFAAPTNLPSGSFPGAYFSLAVADFNGDGKLDVAAPEFVANPVGILNFWAGNGNGTFVNATAVNLPSSSPGSIANGDFNGDGKQDILLGFPNNALIAYGNGDGTFNLASNALVFIYGNTVMTTTGGVTVFAMPLTKDGKWDAVTSDFTTGTLQIAFNGALGKVPPAPGIFSFSLSPGISVIAAGDLNGDGVQDVVVINYQTAQITTILSKTQ
jgi:hypothetical protein